MTQRTCIGWPALFVMFAVIVLSSPPASGQTFNSGSTGSLGAFAPASNTVVTLPADGVLNYTTITIPSGVTVTFQRNAANTPVTMLAQGNVSIAGTIRVNGDDAVVGGTSGSWGVTTGSKGGPGGYNGGDGGLRGSSSSNGTAGQGPGGGGPGLLPAIFTQDGSYGAHSSFVNLIPLYGGSGGGGGVATTTQNGPAGAGGGGAIVIASTTQITIQATGSVTANGGVGSTPCAWTGAGAGSGGAIRLVAPQVTQQGTVQAKGGNNSCVGGGGFGYAGRVRIECTTCTLNATDPVASTSTTLGPITAASTPALTALPTLTITNVAGSTVPATPTGSHASPDLSLAASTPSELTVTLTATNVPVPTQFTVKMLPAMGEPLFFPSTYSTGSFASSTATATVRIPPGVVNVLTAYMSFTQVAGGFPLIDGEEVERVLLAAPLADDSDALVLLQSGRAVALSDLAPQDRQRVVRLVQSQDHRD